MPSVAEPASTAPQLSQFQHHGFVHVREVIGPVQVAELRRFLDDLFSRPGNPGDSDRNRCIGSVRLDVYARHPDLFWFLTHPPIVNALRPILGDNYVVIPETSAHADGYGDWHKDTDYEAKAGKTYFWEPDYLVTTCALYLQPNRPEYGGGLDILPGSHVIPDFLRGEQTLWRRGKRRVALALRALRKAGLYPEPAGPFTIPNRAGDFVVFHYRCSHRASPAAVQPVPVEHRKYALFFTAAANNRHAGNLIDTLRTRPDYFPFFRPDRYSAEMYERARAAGITLR